MSKRLLLVSLFFVITTLPLMAAESGPSNTVGFISFTCNDGVWVPFAFPFTYYEAGHVLTTSLNNIMNGNFTGGSALTGDRIWDQNTLTYAYKNTAGNWTGTLSAVTPGHAYWVRVYPNHVDVTAVTAGEVDTSPLYLGIMQSNAYNKVGLREAGQVAVSALGLVAAGFTGGTALTSDRIWDQNTLTYAYVNAAGTTWSGSLATTGIAPGHALWIYVRPTHASFPWTYTPAGGEFDFVAPVPLINPQPNVVPPASGGLMRKAGSKPVNN